MVTKAPGGAGWIASTEADVRAVLTDERFSVAEIGPAGEVGTVDWLRTSVSRFVNGPAHAQRRSLAIAELARVHPAGLRAVARTEALTRLLDTAPGTEVDVMAGLARLAPAAALATLLGARDPAAVARAVVDCAAGYFPGAEIEVEARADAATAELLGRLAHPDRAVTIAWIALLVQACEATAGLIGLALYRDEATEAALADVLVRTSPVRTMRRVANANLQLDDAAIRAGDPVLCDIDAASDPAVLAFGDGPRACPGAAHARAAAAGVVGAVRATCAAPRGPIEYRPAPALRVPERVAVTRLSAVRVG